MSNKRRQDDKGSFRELFEFTRGERRGIIVLCVLIVIVALLPEMHRYYIRNINPLDFSKLHQEFFAAIDDTVVRKDSLFYFDPNEVTADDMMMLGFEDKLIIRLVNYRVSGGKFRRPSDLLKVYDFPEDLYFQLEPFIQIDTLKYAKQAKKVEKRHANSNNQAKKTADNNKSKYKSENKQIAKKEKYELNSADTSELVKLKGIGRYRAMRIVEYREKLGGYVAVGQLIEAGVPDTVLAYIADRFIIDTTLVKKININTLKSWELVKHPYISNKQGKRMVSFRDDLGKFSKPEDLLKYRLFTEEEFGRLLPYITIEN